MSVLHNEILFLKSENSRLIQKINEVEITYTEISPLPIGNLPVLDNTSDELKIFLIKTILIVSGIFIASFLIYYLSTMLFAPFFQSFIGKLYLMTNNLGIQLVNLFGCIDTNTINFKDGLGNDFRVSLTDNEIKINILIKAENMLDYISLTEHIKNLNNDISTLTSTLNLLQKKSINLSTITNSVVESELLRLSSESLAAFYS